MSRIAGKHKQAGVIAVDLTFSPLPTSAIGRSAARLWGRPEFLDVSRLLIIRGAAVVDDIYRPVSILNAVEAAATTLSSPTGRASAGSRQ